MECLACCCHVYCIQHKTKMASDTLFSDSDLRIYVLSCFATGPVVFSSLGCVLKVFRL